MYFRLISGRLKAVPQEEQFTRIKRKEYAMIKLALRYARYALSALATIGFRLSSN
jgi:hypothetical protein